MTVSPQLTAQLRAPEPVARLRVGHAMAALAVRAFALRVLTAAARS